MEDHEHSVAGLHGAAYKERHCPGCGSHATRGPYHDSSVQGSSFTGFWSAGMRIWEAAECICDDEGGL